MWTTDRSRAARCLRALGLATLAVAGVVAMAAHGACGAKSDGDEEPVLPNEPPPTGATADIVLTPHGISVHGVEVVTFVCKSSEGDPCSNEDRATISRCLGRHDCGGVVLELRDGPGELEAVVRRLTKTDEPVHVSVNRAMPYGLVYTLLETLSKNGFSDIAFVDLEPRWFRGGGMFYRHRPQETIPDGTPIVRIIVTHPGNILVGTNVPGTEAQHITVVDDGVNVAGLHHYLAILPEEASGANATALITGSSDLRWATLARVMALTLERLPARGYGYRGALEGALARSLRADPRPPLIGSRLLTAPTRPEGESTSSSQEGEAP